MVENVVIYLLWDRPRSSDVVKSCDYSMVSRTTRGGSDRHYLPDGDPVSWIQRCGPVVESAAAYVDEDAEMAQEISADDGLVELCDEESALESSP